MIRQPNYFKRCNRKKRSLWAKRARREFMKMFKTEYYDFKRVQVCSIPDYY